MRSKAILSEESVLMANRDRFSTLLGLQTNEFRIEFRATIHGFVILLLYVIIIYKLEASKAINSFINNLFRGEFRL